MNKLMSTYSHECGWPRITQSAMKNNPDFLVVDAAKCGTTSVHMQLKEHPEVFMPKSRKELHFLVHDRIFISVYYKLLLEAAQRLSRIYAHFTHVIQVVKWRGNTLLPILS